MPPGRLKEKRPESPTCGVESRENSSRSAFQASLAVPTVERAEPPRRFWSMTITGEMPWISSTSGRDQRGRRFRVNGG